MADKMFNLELEHRIIGEGFFHLLVGCFLGPLNLNVKKRVTMFLLLQTAQRLKEVFYVVKMTNIIMLT